MAEDFHYQDFTEDSYRRIVRQARDSYAFEPYGTGSDEPHVLWRHDVDYSVHRALRLAEIESEEGVRATYFLMLHGEFYNLLEKAVFERATRLLGLGHDLGLHFDTRFYGGFDDAEQLGERVAYEAGLFEDLFGREVKAFSLHNADDADAPYADRDSVAGLLNTNGRALMEHYTYVSDSNCYWRYRRLPEVIEEGAEERLQVLTHPECWQKEPMSPRERIARCKEGRGDYMMEWYDNLLATSDRPNIGLEEEA